MYRCIYSIDFSHREFVTPVFLCALLAALGLQGTSVTTDVALALSVDKETVSKTSFFSYFNFD